LNLTFCEDVARGREKVLLHHPGEKLNLKGQAGIGGILILKLTDSGDYLPSLAVGGIASLHELGRRVDQNLTPGG